MFFHKWGKFPDEDRIDYIMISKGDFEVDSYKVITDTYDGDYTSDHFPITAIVKLK